MNKYCYQVLFFFNNQNNQDTSVSPHIEIGDDFGDHLQLIIFLNVKQSKMTITIKLKYKYLYALYHLV